MIAHRTTRVRASGDCRQARPAPGFPRQCRRSLALIACWLLCSVPAAAATDPATTLRVSAARAVADTGLVEYLAGEFRKRHPDISVAVSATGALTALDDGRTGKADLIVTHYPPEEQRFLQLGYATQRIQFMYSQYALFGPYPDTLELGKATDFIQAFHLLRDAGAEMLVPSPRSGTYRKLEELWASAGIAPDWLGYENTGSSASATLSLAADAGAYSFADVGLYLANRDRLAHALRPVYRDDVAFRNEISAIVVNASSVPGARQQLAERFLEFLISAPGQQAVTHFSAERFGVAVYLPSAHEDPTVGKLAAQHRLAQETRQRNLSIAIGVIVSLLILTSLGLVLHSQRLERRNWRNALELEQAGRAQAVAQQADRAKSRFLAAMSHEIRTPLNAILGLAQIGLRESATGSSRQHFTHIIDSGQHLLGVINDILDFSKIESGKFRITAQPFQLARQVEKVAGMVRMRADEKGLAFTSHCDASLPAWVTGDALRLQQILLNLLANAIKFTRQGAITLSVRQAGAMTAFTVRDNGIGMSAAVIARLFIPFEQADISITRDHGGTGLGLAISQNLAQLMGGRITVASQPGAGSEFTLELPLPVAQPPADSDSASTGVNGMRLNGLKILAAEDMEINRYILQYMLEQEAARVEFATDGQQVLDRLERAGADDPDLVLMDVQMPVMDGLTATRRLQEIAPGLPVIGLTAHALAEERERCLAAGMVDHVAKPIDAETLVTVILRHARAVPPAANRTGSA